jgi:hypothetical protein
LRHGQGWQLLEALVEAELVDQMLQALKEVILKYLLLLAIYIVHISAV